MAPNNTTSSENDPWPSSQSDVSAEITRFRDFCLEHMPALRSLSDRISRCFWFDLLTLNVQYDVAASDILGPVMHLERGEPSTGLKPATRFIRHPLRGLWHKHWFSNRFMPANLRAAMQRGDARDWIWEVAKEGDILTEQVINRIAHRFTIKAFEDRHAAKQMTGEWIVFLPRDGLNYYLCLGTHATGDAKLHDKIVTLCALDYPDIATWLSDAAADVQKATDQVISQ